MCRRCFDTVSRPSSEKAGPEEPPLQQKGLLVTMVLGHYESTFGHY
jgi:hypothetical protein